MMTFHRASNAKMSWIAVCVILISVLSYDIRDRYWNDYHKIISWDVLSYYAYLPATYIYDDISLGFILENPKLYGDKFWPQGTPTGKFAIKTTMGLSFLYAPFFFIAHPAAQMLGYEVNGYSPPYKFALTMSCLFYLTLGFAFLRKVLLHFFPDHVAALALIAVALGTNLLHYATAEATMPHSYNFALFSIFLYLSMQWHEHQNFKFSLILGLTAGLIALIRPTNILVLIVFALWNVSDAASFRDRALLFFKKYHLVSIMALAFVAVWIPQLIYWKYISGSFWFYSYGNERFFFNNPHIFKGLLGFRKGWFIYTPMMALAIAGIGMMFYKLKGLFYGILVFTILNIYVILSWWSWWYGGSFGQRAFIESYAILSIPLGVFVQWALGKGNAVKIASASVFMMLIALNIFQTRQYQRAILHWDGMTAKAYWSIFLKMKLPDKFNQLLDVPDNEKAKLGLEK
jgi:hypothetical protein